MVATSPNLASSKPILVTGAGGWISSHVIYQLLEKGYKVRGTVRSLKASKYEFLSNYHPRCKTHLELVECDLLSDANWSEAVKGVEFVLHLASPFTFNYRDAEKELVRPAVEGVQRLFDAVTAHNTTCDTVDEAVKRIVLTSSVCSVVYGHSPERYACTRKLVLKDQEARAQKIRAQAAAESGSAALHPPSLETVTSSNEGGAIGKDAKDGRAQSAVNAVHAVNLPNHLGIPEYVNLPTGDTLGDFKLFTEDEFSNVDTIIGYELSKTKAELHAWELLKAHNEKCKEDGKGFELELTAMCPGFVFGPIFCKAHGYGESASQIQRIILKRYPFIPDINSAHVDVRDVADCHIRGFELPSEAVANKRFLLAADDGNLDFKQQAAIIAKHFKPYGFCPAQSTAPSFLLSVGQYLFPSVKAAVTKLPAVTYCSNTAARQTLGMTKWRSTEGALHAHCLTLIKYCVIEQRKVPQALLDSYRPYATDPVGNETEESST